MVCMNYHDKYDTKQQAARMNKGACAASVIAEVAITEKHATTREVQHKRMERLQEKSTSAACTKQHEQTHMVNTGNREMIR